MKRKDVVSTILKEKLVAIVRSQLTFNILHLAEALYNNGLRIMEITYNTPGVLRHIELLRKEFNEDMLVGAGTITDFDGAKKVIESGAQLIVTPATPDGLIPFVHQYEIPVLAGAYTPLEILTVHQAGADIVKLFPAEQAGPSYLKAVKAPFDNIPIMPTGGIYTENIGDWLTAGACAFGLGSALVNDKDIEAEDWAKSGAKAKAFRLEIDKYNS